MSTEPKPIPDALWRAWRAYRLRWKRRYFIARAIRRHRQLAVDMDRTDRIAKDQVLLFSTVRNEAARLPHFLDHYRALGVDHFLIVANDCSDETVPFLRDQPDVSLWCTCHSYKAARFGVDWLTYLQWCHAGGHWAVTVDADELLVFPGYPDRNLRDLGRWLEDRGQSSFGAVMLDLYPQGRLDHGTFVAGDDPLDHLHWFDADNFTRAQRPELGSQIVRGGVRLRKFFGSMPERAPTMNKVPFVKWSRRYAYMTSTHVILPPPLNGVDDPRLPYGAILHTKFLPQVVARSREEKQRGEHFSNSELYDDYYDRLSSGGALWYAGSVRYEGPQQLVGLRLVNSGDWLESGATDG